MQREKIEKMKVDGRDEIEIRKMNEVKLYRYQISNDRHRSNY